MSIWRDIRSELIYTRSQIETLIDELHRLTRARADQSPRPKTHMVKAVNELEDALEYISETILSVSKFIDEQGLREEVELDGDRVEVES